MKNFKSHLTLLASLHNANVFPVIFLLSVAHVCCRIKVIGSGVISAFLGIVVVFWVQ